MKTQLYDAMKDCFEVIPPEDRTAMFETFDEWSDHIPERFRHAVKQSLEACVNKAVA